MGARKKRMKGICLLGSTGQIGVRVLDVLRGLPGFRVVSLAARSNVEAIARQIAAHAPPRAVLLDPSFAVLAQVDAVAPGGSATARPASASGGMSIPAAVAEALDLDPDGFEAKFVELTLRRLGERRSPDDLLLAVVDADSPAVKVDGAFVSMVGRMTLLCVRAGRKP